MIEDDVGNLWLSTNAGISQLDPTRKKLINYDFSNDLQEENFLERSAYKGKDGSLFFGGNNGITQITPAQVKKNNHIPSVVITDVWVDNELLSQYTIDQKQSLNLTFDTKNIKFRFAAIDFQEPSNNMHSYRLVGFDEEWSQASNSRTASYTNLVPGEYYFEVKGSNNSNVWNPKVTSVKIIITPPWWQRWWAYTIYTLILISAVFTFIRFQKNKVILERNLKLQLEQKVKERTAELELELELELEKEKSSKILFERNLNSELEQKVADRTAELEQQKLAVEEKNREVELKNEEILATQQQMVQSEKMASLGTLTAGVAHEINNPTNYASMAVYLMKDEIQKVKDYLKKLAGGAQADARVLQSFDEKFAKLVGLTETAREGTKRIQTIVEDLRTFARLGDVEKSQVKISELIKSTVHLVKTQYDTINIKTQLDYDPLLTCFSSKLNQVFMNMIVNACQAVETRQEKELEIEKTQLTSY
ncbi:MAG: hypothetical protein HRT38_20320, partial [Alteromonadaceae bacterium]|nr:hypothetical protein [Alteromonadaceae bacterium]